MIGIGSMIGAAAGVGASIFGGISASKAIKKAKEMTEQQQRENDDWYDRRYNEDATQRADAQRLLTQMGKSLRDRGRQDAATAAVMGGTEESVAAGKAANSQAMADAVSQVAVNAERQKERIEDSYLQNRKELATELKNYEINKANAMTQAAQGAASAASSLGSAIDEPIG